MNLDWTTKKNFFYILQEMKKTSKHKIYGIFHNKKGKTQNVLQVPPHTPQNPNFIETTGYVASSDMPLWDNPFTMHLKGISSSKEVIT